MSQVVETTETKKWFHFNLNKDAAADFVGSVARETYKLSWRAIKIILIGALAAIGVMLGVGFINNLAITPLTTLTVGNTITTLPG